MGEQEDDRALVGELGDGRKGRAKTSVVADLPFLHRHVEIDPDEDPLPLDLAEVVERTE